MHKALISGCSALAIGALVACGGSAPPAETAPAAAEPEVTAPAEPAEPAEPAPAEAKPEEKKQEAAIELRRCSEFVDAPEGLIDDGEDGDKELAAQGGRAGGWGIGSDDKGTTVTIPAKDNFAMQKGGAEKSKMAARMQGKVGSGEGAYGASMTATLNNWQAYDASKFDGISFWAKAGPKSTKTVRLRMADAQTIPQGGICKACWNHFGKDVELTGDWKKYTVSFADLAQQDGWGDPRPPSLDSQRIWSVEWSVGGAGADFDIWVDNVRFVQCK
jgi:hypothetical protein